MAGSVWPCNISSLSQHWILIHTYVFKTELKDMFFKKSLGSEEERGKEMSSKGGGCGDGSSRVERGRSLQEEGGARSKTPPG